MKKISLHIGIVLLMMLTMGCPYESEVPITQKGIPVPNSILGRWYDVNQLKKPLEFRDYYEVVKRDSFKVLILKHEYSAIDRTFTTDQFLAFFSKVDNDIFMNCQMINTKPPKNQLNYEQPANNSGSYFIYKIGYIGTMIRVSEVSNNIQENFNTSNELLKFILKNKDLSFFYNKGDSHTITLINSGVVDK